MSVSKLLLPRLRRLEGLQIIWYNLEKRDLYVLQGVLLVSCEETMSFTSCLQNWLIGTRIELVGTPGCFGLVFELATLHQWPISSSLIEIMSLGNQSHQLLNHLREHPLILGRDLVSPGSLHLPKWKNLILISDSFECIAETTCFCPHSLRYLIFGFAYFINLLIACKNKKNYLPTTKKCSRTNHFTETANDKGNEKSKSSVCT